MATVVDMDMAAMEVATVATVVYVVVVINMPIDPWVTLCPHLVSCENFLFLFTVRKRRIRWLRRVLVKEYGDFKRVAWTFKSYQQHHSDRVVERKNS